MNIENLHESLKAEEVLNIHPIIREAFNNYKDAKLEKLSIFFYNNASQTALNVNGYAFRKDGDTFGFPESEDYLMNIMKSSFQMFCGKLKNNLMFLDFFNEFYVLVDEKDADEYINALFTKEGHHLITDNDFSPFKNRILCFSNSEELEEYILHRI